MRELHVTRFDSEDEKVILSDPTTEEEFWVAADDKLRAAAEGELTPPEEEARDSSPKMHPSEIQELIRGGASPEELRERSGLQRNRLENLARPILMERANMVRRAQKSHPMLANGPSETSLEMAVNTGLSTRGIAYSEASWDSWKTPEGHWIIELRWQDGRADNTAHWRFQQDRSYAVTSPLDDAATDITDPEYGLRRPRQVATISNLGEARLRKSQTSKEARLHLAAAAQRDAAGIPDSSRPGSAHRRTPGYVDTVTVNMEDVTAPTMDEPVRGVPEDTPEDATQRTTEAFAAAEQLHLSVIEEPPPGVPKIAPLAHAPRTKAGATEAGTGDAKQAEDEEDKPRKRRGRNKKPAMPSWEDVLLGVRGQHNE
ncbi:MAG TPA: DUF3071 domain-containing protein [Corynebacteriales bacterium]|nr:DUF3071 domain-containing protein [Mycobacteriales bacterium]